MRNLSQVPAKTSNLFNSLSGTVLAACAATALTLLAATSAMAAPVTYTFQIDLTGHNASVGGVALSGPLTITATGDTDDMQHEVDDFGYGTLTNSSLDNLVATFSVAGFGSFTTTAPFSVFSTDWRYDDGSSNLIAGIRPNWDTWIGFDQLPYELHEAASFGPFSTSATNDENHYGWGMDAIDTTAGVFAIESDASPLNATFTVTVSSANAVPEPDSLALFAGAGAALLLVSRRRKQAKQAS